MVFGFIMTMIMHLGTLRRKQLSTCAVPGCRNGKVVVPITSIVVAQVQLMFGRCRTFATEAARL